MKQRSEIEVGSIPDVLSFFGVGTSQKLTPVNNGLANHNYVTATDQGDLVVKFLVTQTPETIENDVAIQQQLQQKGVGTPHYVRNRDGEYLYRGHGALNAVLSEKIDGVTPCRMSVGLVSDIGRHLALFHTTVVACPNPNEAGLLNPGMSGVNTEWARALLDQPLPRGIIHGDLHSGNVLVDPLQRDRVIAILDFEEAGENLYLIDLAVALMAVSSSTDCGEAIEPELMRTARQGYANVRKLTDQEVVWLPRAIRYTSEAWINWFMANGFDEYARQHQRRYDSFQEVFGEHLAV